MLSRNQALRELNNKPKQYFLTYYRFTPLCCRWGKKKKEGRESKKPWWANIPSWLTCTPRIHITDIASSAARSPQLWASGFRKKMRAQRITCKFGIVWEKPPCTAQFPTRARSSSGNVPRFIAEEQIYFIAHVLTCAALRTWKHLPWSALGFCAHPDPGKPQTPMQLVLPLHQKRHWLWQPCVGFLENNRFQSTT